MDFWNYLNGAMTVELTSADSVGVLQTLSDCGIILQNVDFVEDLTFRCQIRRRDYAIVHRLAEKKGYALRICEKSGLYWSVKSLVKRPVFIAGIAMLLALVLLLPTRVLIVQVEGNDRIPSRQIQAAAEACGIRFWASRRTVRSEKVKNALLGALPELTWAGVNTRGCVAVISVQERMEAGQQEADRAIGSIVAVRDGVVEFCTALKGNMLCQVGQAVKAGDVLISAYTDCGICIRVNRAEGEVFARTRHKMNVMALSTPDVKGEIIDVKHKYSLLVGKKRINLWKDSGIWQGSCDRMYKECYITLPGNFVLPVAFVRETFRFRDVESPNQDSTLLQNNLKACGRDYVTQQMVAGRILNGSETFHSGADFIWMEGIYLCSEMIGRMQTEKIGE